MQPAHIMAHPQREQAPTQNLPAQLTPLIGREQEVAAACTLLRRPEVRLVTLTGMGGIGKTRLALQVATDLLADFADGVCFVSLAPVSDPDLVVPTIVQTLGLKDPASQALLDLLRAYLSDKQLLLLLDNFEQVLAAAPQLAELLVACAHLKMLVTSRAVLHLRGEHEFPVPPLALPDLRQLPERETLAQVAAVALFLQRAWATNPDLQLTAPNARAIAQICVQLDGLPLAIELAAVRSKLFPPQALLVRLGQQRLAVLTSGAQDAPARQQTLRATIAWSYNLLNAQEQQLFRRLSVFVGGGTLQAVETLCTSLEDGRGAAWILDGVASLLDKSLLKQTEREGEEPRLLMLETIREYGLERLAAQGEVEITRWAHADYYLILAEEAESELGGPNQVAWLEQLEREHDNLRVALRWWLERGEAEQGKGDGREMALRLAGALQWFWQVHGHFSEGRTFLEQALTGSKEVASPVRAKALFAAAQLAHFQGDDGQAEALLEESLTLYRDLQDLAGVAFSLHILGRVAGTKGNLAAARSLFEEALALWKGMGDKKQIAYSLENLAILESREGKYTRGCALCEESLAIQRELGNKVGISDVLLRLAWIMFLSQDDLATVRSLVRESLVLSREVGDKRGIADCCYLSGHIALSQDDAFTARALAEEGLQLYREVGDQQNIAQSLWLIVRVATAQGDHAAARTLYEQSLAIEKEGNYKWDINLFLEGLAGVVAAQGESAWAARLYGAVEALRDALSVPIPPVYRAEYERSVTATRTQLGEQAFAAAWAEGRMMTLEQALAARERVTPPQPFPAATSTSQAKSSITSPDGLSVRELEVLRLLATGLTDAQIAEHLVLSLHTVHAHLRTIYSKLGVTSRSAATRYAFEHQLV